MITWSFGTMIIPMWIKVGNRNVLATLYMLMTMSEVSHKLLAPRGACLALMGGRWLSVIGAGGCLGFRQDVFLNMQSYKAMPMSIYRPNTKTL